MAVAMKCDICGVLFSRNGCMDTNNIAFRHIIHGTSDTIYNNKTYDICPVCREAIYEVLVKRGLMEVTDE